MNTSKHAGSDSETYWLRPVVAITANGQPESGRKLYAGSDFPRPIWFRFSQEGPDHIVQNRSGSDLDGLVRFGANASCPEVSRCARTIGPGFRQNATGLLPLSHFQTRLRSSTDGPDHIVQNHPESDWVLADLDFGQPDPFRKQACVQESWARF